MASANNTRSIQVLNISNVNAQGNTVLNDGKLLELIQKYPFLYNPRVKGHNDFDYRMWAWKNINAAFNLTYANDPSAAFSTQELMDRWQILKPLIQCLSKAYDLEAIPQSLRQSVVSISAALENQSTGVVSRNNQLQSLLWKHMPDIAELPLDKRISLEKEIIDLILACELESKQCPKLDETALKEVNQEAEEFLEQIGFQDVLHIALNKTEDIFYSNQSSALTKTEDNFYSNQSSQKCFEKPKWVKIKDAHKYTRRCYVRISRVNIEDYLPLSKIIQFSRKK